MSQSFLKKINTQCSCDFIRFTTFKLNSNLKLQLVKMEKIIKFFCDFKLKLKQKWQRHQMQFLIDVKDFFVCQSFFDSIDFPFLRFYNANRDFYRRAYFYTSSVCLISFIKASVLSTCIYINSPTRFEQLQKVLLIALVQPQS